MAQPSFLEEDPNAEPTPLANNKRTRWATQRLKAGQGGRTRGSIIGRLNKATHHGEKKRDSGDPSKYNPNTHDPTPDPLDEAEEEDDEDGAGPRSVFVNMELPPQFTDDDGKPKTTYKRNKIRTAKYTPLSFIPKNLFYQFHNIANIYFLFTIILTVSSSFRYGSSG